ncbi:BglG family transcription antiterminator [Faecalicoccus pleomorphus]|uniref:Transcription antiterminator n=2 Tax=Faecalicoccus TaxID=1573536 RepID=A0A3E3E6R1_9FIRM|nr:BglG family transcription antiterminator [Faecalicoccus pleomorphus]MBM6678386.1 transcription antiterminator [Faecalicoccus pleomorphus]MDB7984653.1 BglG family transcription antiterminator [Faecalicoccus pleomorphus]RGD77634.1 transcription antiterminator [Faecalicoccus pleomorphus]
MLNKRQEKIIMLLQDSKKWITGKEFARLMNVSDRTIRSDIDTINRTYNAHLIESNLRSGYRINEEILTTLPIELNAVSIPQTPDERCTYILQELILEKKQINLLDLQEQVFISGYSIDNDIKRIKKMLEPYQDLSLIRSKNCIRLDGSEESKRKLYKQLLFEETQGNFLNLNRLSSMFHDLDLEYAKEVLDKMFKKYNFHVREMQKPMLMIHVGIALERMIHHNYVETSRDTPELRNTKEYSITKEFFDTMAQSIHIDVNENEVVLLALLLRGKKAITMHNDLVQSVTDGINVNDLVTKIVTMIKEDFDIDFVKDLDLRTGLALHIQGLIERKKKDIVVSNLYLQELKRKYPLVFELAIHVGQILNETLDMQVSENEVGFLALHLGAAYERSHSFQKYRVVMIYPVDQAFGDILLRKVDTLFSERMTVINCSSFFEEKMIKELNPDLILTTLQLQHNLDISTIQISLFISTEDESKIFQALNALDKKRYQQKFEDELIDLIEPELFYKNLELRTPTEVITYMCDNLEKKGYCDSSFKEAVLKREEVAATSFVYSFAVPHSLNVPSFRPAISVGFLKRPIKWGEFDVKMVLLLAVNEEHQDLLIMFFEWLSGMINNANHFAALLETKDYDDFVAKIVE